MRRVPCNYLQPGMKLACHIYSDDGRILLAKDVVLEQAYIERLINKDIPAVYVDDDLSTDVSISDVVLQETRVTAVKCVKNSFKRVLSKSTNKDNLVLSEIKTSISDIVDQLLSNRGVIYDLVDIRSVDDYLFGHSVNVCILALMTGMAMRLNRNQLEQLAVGAILHDIGKALVPPAILNKPGRLSDREFEVMQKHPAHSLDILRRNSNIDSVSRMIAYQHHEKYNGEGYPLGKKNQEILDMSQIVGMVDMYDAITSNRCYRKAMPPNEAYELIAGSGDHYFKFEIVKAFLSQVAAYPSGTLVQLSSGETAIVVENYKNFPLLPKVRILLEPDGSQANPLREISLAGQTTVVIKRVLDEEEVQKVLYYIKKMGFLKR